MTNRKGGDIIRQNKKCAIRSQQEMPKGNRRSNTLRYPKCGWELPTDSTPEKSCTKDAEGAIQKRFCQSLRQKDGANQTFHFCFSMGRIVCIHLRSEHIYARSFFILHSCIIQLTEENKNGIILANRGKNKFRG